MVGNSRYHKTVEGVTTLRNRIEFWIDGRVVEGASLENWRTAMFRGFESYSIRQIARRRR